MGDTFRSLLGVLTGRKPYTLMDPDHPFEGEIGFMAEFGANVILGNRARIGDFARLGSEVRIGTYASIGRAVCIGDQCRIGCYATVSHSARLGHHVTLGAFARVARETIVPTGTVLDTYELMTPRGRFIDRMKPWEAFYGAGHVLVTGMDGPLLIPLYGPNDRYANGCYDEYDRPTIETLLNEYQWDRVDWLKDCRISKPPESQEELDTLLKRIREKLALDHGILPDDPFSNPEARPAPTHSHNTQEHAQL